MHTKFVIAVQVFHELLVDSRPTWIGQQPAEFYQKIIISNEADSEIAEYVNRQMV